MRGSSTGVSVCISTVRNEKRPDSGETLPSQGKEESIKGVEAPGRRGIAPFRLPRSCPHRTLSTGRYSQE